MTTLKSITLKGYIANWDKKNKERSWDPINPHGTRKEMNNINGLNLISSSIKTKKLINNFKSNSECKLESNSECKLESNSECKLESTSECKLESNSECKLESNSESKLENNSECKLESNSGSKLENNSESELENILENNSNFYISKLNLENIIKNNSLNDIIKSYNI
jgi:superfamily II DNA helicase RecQ